MGIKYGMGWGGARISLSRDLYSQESSTLKRVGLLSL